MVIITRVENVLSVELKILEFGVLMSSWNLRLVTVKLTEKSSTVGVGVAIFVGTTAGIK